MELMEGGDLARVQLLVQQGEDFDKEDALRDAAEEGHLEVVRYLFSQCGADVDAPDQHGYTALMLAAENEHLDVVQYLTQECGADTNAKTPSGNSTLMCVTECGNFQIFQYLVEHCGADVKATNNNGYAPLVSAAIEGYVEIVHYLVERCGLNVDATYGDGDTALMWAASYGNLEIVRYLAEQGGAEVNQANGMGYTALAWAAYEGQFEVVQYLVEHCNAKVNIKRDDGDTALMRAAASGNIQVVQYLYEKGGANVKIMNKEGYTALLWAAKNDEAEVVHFLAGNCDADVNVFDIRGYTALMFASQQGNLELARYLAEDCGADVTVKNNEGMTAVRLAADGGHDMIQRMLTPMLPAPQAQPRGTDSEALPSYCSIPPSEIELVYFNKNGYIGGEFLAKWLDADAVVKLFIPDASHSSFQDGVRLWQQLRHPNVMKMYGACDAGPHLKFFVCEYASQKSLHEVVSSVGEKPTMWKYLYEAALGLEYLHERGIVHGDLRCSNILIGTDGMAKLSNFGFSGSMKTSSPATSTVLGSMRWQAPEVLDGKPTSYESDVYALGMCILEATTGEIPWRSKDDKAVRRYCKTLWMPETDDDLTFDPDCPPGHVRELVWKMCSFNPFNRASLSSVIFELENLAIKNICSTNHEPESSIDEYDNDRMHDIWLDLRARMEKCDNDQHRRVFKDIEKIQERLQGSNYHPTLFAQFYALLIEFRQTIKMSPEQASIMRLSSTRATSTSLYSFHWRIKSLLTSLGDLNAVDEREERWQLQRNQEIDRLATGVSDTLLFLKELKSPEERTAYLRTLQDEMENHHGKYTPDQLHTMKQSYEEFAGEFEDGQFQELTPVWFIPWYELIVDDWNCLGEGGFGSVCRAKWLDSDVVVKRVTFSGSNRSDDDLSTFDLSQSSLSSLSASVDSSDITDEIIASKREEALTMFHHEVDIWFGFSHPHVIRLFGACHVGRPFFVCEYATNGTLVSYLRKNPDQLWIKLYEAALGVQYLHARNVVHGDLKGNNIVIGSDMKAKVTDFGLSSLASSKITPQISAAAHWVAPECLLRSSARPTFASDVYSLGMCIVEALRVVDAVKSGNMKQPYLPWGNQGNFVVKSHATKGKLPAQPKTCNAEQWNLIRRMCTFDPDRRIKISTVVDELARLADTSQENDVANTLSYVTQESVLKVIANVWRLLSDLQTDAETVLYISLWKRFEQVLAQINDNQSEEYPGAFFSLVVHADKATMKLNDNNQSLISLAEKTMRYYALDRALDKFCDAYFITSELGDLRREM